MLEFVHLSGSDAGKDSQTRKKVRSQAMRDFRRRQREEKDAAGATHAPPTTSFNTLHVPIRRSRAFSTPPSNAAAPSGISKRRSRTKSQRTSPSVGSSPQSEPCYDGPVEGFSTLPSTSSVLIPSISFDGHQQSSDLSHLPLIPMPELSPDFHHTWPVDDSPHFEDQYTLAPDAQSIYSTTTLGHLYYNFEGDSLASSVLPSQSDAWSTAFSDPIPLWTVRDPSLAFATTTA